MSIEDIMDSIQFMSPISTKDLMNDGEITIENHYFSKDNTYVRKYKNGEYAIMFKKVDGEVLYSVFDKYGNETKDKFKLGGKNNGNT